MRILLLFIVLSGCGAATTARSATTPATAPPTTPPTQQTPEIIEVSTGQTLTFESLVDRLARARVVYVGERHDRAEDHEAQRRILEALAARDPEIAIGFEMFQRPYQGALDAYVAGEIDEDELLARTEWQTRWGYDFAMYRPLVASGARRGTRLLALNAPREVTRTIAREGLDALDAETRDALPELDREVAAHRARVVEALAHHPHMDDAMLERFYTAQLVWDETMAQAVASHPGRLIVFAGAMHVARDAIPERAARRGASPFLIVLPDDELTEDTPADFVWRTTGR